MGPAGGRQRCRLGRAENPGQLLTDGLLPLEISLDPELSPQDNAARLFQSAKRGERGERVAQARLVSTRKTLAGLAQARRDIASLPPKDALVRLRAVLQEAGVRISERGDGQ